MSEQPLTEQPAAVPAMPSLPASVPPVPPLPPGPPVGPYDPANVWAVPPYLAPPVRAKRTWVRTALRWSTAVVICLAVGAGTAFAVLAPRRTDIPGLRTAADSRYTFPGLKLPSLPPKVLTPAQGQAATGNPLHAADLRKLLLPAPLGAKTDSRFASDTSGWYPTASYVDDMSKRSSLRSELNDFGVRHIAVRAWTAPDGVSTEIYLLQFHSGSDGYSVYEADEAGTRPSGGTDLDADLSMTFPGLMSGMGSSALSQSPAPGRPGMRLAFVNIGDVDMVVVMSSKSGSVPLVNFRQVVALQSELLQG